MPRSNPLTHPQLLEKGDEKLLPHVVVTCPLLGGTFLCSSLQLVLRFNDLISRTGVRKNPILDFFFLKCERRRPFSRRTWLRWQLIGNCRTVSIVDPPVETGFSSLLSCHMRSPSFVSTAHTHTNIHTPSQRLPDTHGPHTLRARGRRPSRGSVKGLMWDCWVTLDREQIGLRGQPSLHCKEELICLCEWVLSPSAGSCLCCRPLDLPAGADRRMRSGNLNSFVTQRNPIQEFFDLKKDTGHSDSRHCNFHPWSDTFWHMNQEIWDAFKFLVEGFKKERLLRSPQHCCVSEWNSSIQLPWEVLWCFVGGNWREKGEILVWKKHFWRLLYMAFNDREQEK